MIGEAIYHYIRENVMKVDERSVKLTQLLDTHLCKSGRNDKEATGFIAISSYYLWFLIDNGFIVDDVKSIMIFSKHTEFKGFVEEFIRLRQQAILDKNKGLGNFFKPCLNSSYGQKIINEEKFTKVMLCNTHQTLNNHLKPNFINTIKFNNDVYQCELARKTFGCKTPIQCRFFTLDNAKYWVLNFYYNFMEKCFDNRRFHYIE
jgi:hypothetical protein